VTPAQEEPAWKFWLAVVVLVLAIVGGIVAGVMPQDTPMPCLGTTSGQTLCPPDSPRHPQA